MNEINACADSNRVSSHEKNRRSRTGVCVRYRNVRIYEISKSQKWISLSSTEDKSTALVERCIAVV